MDTNELKAKIIELVKERGRLKVLDVITSLNLKDTRTNRDKIRSLFLELANCEYLTLETERGAYVLKLSSKYLEERKKEEEERKKEEFSRIKKELAKKLDNLELSEILDKIGVYWDYLDCLEVYDYFRGLKRDVRYLEGRKFTIIFLEKEYYILESFLFDRIKKLNNEYWDLRKLLKIISKFGGVLENG